LLVRPNENKISDTRSEGATPAQAGGVTERSVFAASPGSALRVDSDETL